ncbi:hypothetical protein HBB16_04005 [Pseudonocardia sp. MCCB 268]|nr:hypothetical protein [Pseudonocardia cytotoxica]
MRRRAGPRAGVAAARSCRAPAGWLDEATLVELAGEDLVGMRTGYGLRDLADQLLADAGVRPRVVLETAAGDRARHGGGGHGVALLPRLAAGEGPTVPLADPAAIRELGVVSRASAHVSPPVQGVPSVAAEHGRG